MNRKAPSQGKDKNGGSYGTPMEFLRAVNLVYPIGFDLAADKDNSVTRRLHGYIDSFFSKEQGAFNHTWSVLAPVGHDRNWLFLNPPFDNINPWAEKCAMEGSKGARILFLVPQGTQKWYTEHCRPNALELRLAGRMTFEGQPTPYPKDLSLFVFGLGMNGEAVWDWRKK